MCYSSYEAKRHGIVHDVCHEHMITFVFEDVLMVPEGIWPEALLINKEMAVFTVSDFCSPAEAHKWRWLNAVVDDHSRMHLLPSNIGQNAKLHIVRCNLIEIFRTREVFPGLFKSCVEFGLSFERINFHVLSVWE